MKSLGFDAETSAMYIAAHVNFQRAGILKTVGIYPKNALKEIASVKIVPFVVAETLEAEKLVRPTVGCVVRVAYSDGAVKYCDDGAYGEEVKYDNGAILGGEVDLKSIPNFTRLVENEEDLPEFNLEINGFNKLASKREAEAAERLAAIERFLQAQEDEKKKSVPLVAKPKTSDEEAAK